MVEDSGSPSPNMQGAGRQSTQPRDGLFRFVFSQPEHAASELRSAVPEQLLDLLDLDHLEPVPGTFVDTDLRQQHTDALFATRWAGHDAYLYLLLEHQSSPDPLMAWRMLRYQVRIWERHLKLNPDTVRLPVIVPLVIYQGRRPWSASTEFADLLDIDPAVHDSADSRNAGIIGMPSFRYLLDDLSNVDDSFLLSRPLTDEARVSFLFLNLPPGYAEPDVVLVRWEQTLATIGSRPNGSEVLTALAAYIWNISSGSGRERMREVMTTLEPEAAKGFVSIADVIHAEGRAEGQAELFTQLLTLRFGSLSPEITAAVAAASSEQITAWSTRFVEGTLTLDEITD